MGGWKHGFWTSGTRVSPRVGRVDDGLYALHTNHDDHPMPRATLSLPITLLCLCTSQAASCTGARRASQPVRAQPAAPPQELAQDILARQASQRLDPAQVALEPLAGEWHVTVEVPGRGSPIGRGEAHLSWVHAGLFLRWEVFLELDGQELELTGYLGHDRARDRYQALWLSDLASGMTLLEGRGDLAGSGLVLGGVSAEAAGQSRMRLTDPDTLVVESFGLDAGSRAVLLRRTTYRRVTPVER